MPNWISSAISVETVEIVEAVEMTSLFGVVYRLQIHLLSSDDGIYSSPSPPVGGHSFFFAKPGAVLHREEDCRL